MQRTPAILYKRYEILYSMAQPKYIPSSFFFFFCKKKKCLLYKWKNIQIEVKPVPKKIEHMGCLV